MIDTQTERRMSTLEKPIAKLTENPAVWHHLCESYAKEQLPKAWEWYVLLDGWNGPMLGNIYEDQQRLDQPDRYVVKVATAQGLIDAVTLGCKRIAIVNWPDAPRATQATKSPAEPAASASLGFNLEQAVADEVNQEALAKADDGMLLRASQLYQSYAEQVKRGETIAVMGWPKSTYPAEVWEACQAAVQEEIKRRMILTKIAQ